MKLVRFLLLIASLIPATPAMALDSYRFLHVTIETPWIIFIFLFFLVFTPMILSAVLYWHYALKKRARGEEEGDEVDEG